MSRNRLKTARAIKACLQYLQVDAREAHLMTVSDSIDLLIADLDEVIGLEANADQGILPGWLNQS